MSDRTPTHRHQSTDGRADAPLREDDHPVSVNELLLDQLRTGHAQAQALDALFRQHYAHVYRVLYRLVGDEADDLSQEVFLRLYHQPPQEAVTDVEAWLYRVAMNLGYNALRSQRRRERYRALFGTVTGALGWRRDAADPAGEAMQREEARQVRVILAQLRERDATILLLRHEGLSYREVARAVGVAPSSVGTLLARAERAFRAAYEARYGEWQGGEEG